jgi:hypothetical protein
MICSADLSRVAVAHLTVASPPAAAVPVPTAQLPTSTAAASTTLSISARARAHACDAFFGAGETSVATLILDCLLNVRARQKTPN